MTLSAVDGAPSGLAAARPPRPLLVVSALAAALVCLPLAATLWRAAEMPAADAVALLVRPLVGRLLVNTLGLIAAATAITTVLGMAAAWLVERTALPGRRAWAVVAAAPLAVPPFVSSYAWVSLSPALQDFAGALLVVCGSYYPLVYLPVAAALRGLDPTLEESARALGQTPWGAFRRVVLPQLRPALLGGMLLVALHMLTEFGAFALLRFRTFTTELFVEYRTGFNGPGAALLAVVLLLLCLALLAAELTVRGSARYARVGRGARRHAELHALGWVQLPVLAGFALLAAATLGVPLGMILFWLTQHSAAAIAPGELSVARLAGATLSSLWLGVAGAAVTVVLALPLGYLDARYRGRLVTLIERTAFVARGVPGIVVALALIALTVRAAPLLYQSAALLMAAYAILFLPLALVSVRGALLQAPPVLEESARSLGLGWPETVRRVVLPLAAPGLGAGMALVFLSVVTELTATLLLAPIGTETLATQVWANCRELAFAAAAPYAALMLALSLLSSWLLARRYGGLALATA